MDSKKREIKNKYKNKHLILHLLDILLHESDENHPVSTAEILAILNDDYNITADRKAIYSGVDALIEFGYDIISTRTPKSGWFMASRKFELPEIRLLADAVASANFITTKKANELISKLSVLCSNNDFKDISKQLFLERRVRNENEEIFYNIDRLQSAISKKRRVNIKYYKHKMDENGKVTLSSKSFERISPYGLAWVDDHYYLLCNYSKYNNIMHLRLDRIKNVEILDEPVRNVSEVSRYINGFDTADYIRKTFNMFGGNLETVMLRCPHSLIDGVYDRFGKDISIFNADSETFSFSTPALVSEGLISFIIQFDGTEVLRPESLREKIKERVERLNQMYSD